MLCNGKVFISHSHEDNERCLPLLKALQTWGVDYWYDKEQLLPGRSITARIQQAINDRHVFVKICSMAAQAKSYWLDEEYGAFKSLQASDENAGFKGRRIFIPLILDAAYQVQPFENVVLWIRAYDRPEQEWLEELRKALGIELEANRDRPEDAVPGWKTQKQSSRLPLAVQRSTAVERMLAEMDAALTDEIDTVQRFRRKHTAVDGRLLGTLEGQFLYSFVLEEPWEAQEDSLLAVDVPQVPQKKVSATVVTCSGTKITIIATEPLAEDALKKIYLYDDPIRLLEALREALTNSQETTSLLGSKTFGLEKYTPRRMPIVSAFPGFAPTASQRDAIELALGSDVAYIIGPPGTGKTATLAAIAFSHLNTGRSVLICAHTNIAVDNAVLEVSKMSDGLAMLEEGKIVRYGAPKLDAVRRHEYIYPPNVAKRRGQALERQKRATQTSLQTILAELEARKRDARERANKWEQGRNQLNTELTQSEKELAPIRAREQTRLQQLAMAISAIDQQIAAAQRDLTRIRDDLAQLARQRVQQQSLLERHIAQMHEIEQRIAEAQGLNGLVRFLKQVNLKRLTHQLADLQYQSAQTQHAFSQIDARITLGQQRRSDLERRLSEMADQRRQFEEQRNTPSPNALRKAQLEATIERTRRILSEGDVRHKQATEEVTVHERSLQRDAEQLRAQIGEIDAQLVEVEKRIVAQAALVATTLTKIYMGAAIRDRRFDVVIIDEVSIAPLPALYIAAVRADSKVTIVGDPYQLSPIAHAETPAAKYWLKRDVFAHARVTLDSDGDKRTAFLDQQFRMHPAISVIARKHIYQNRLQDGPIPPYPEYENVRPVPGAPLILCDTSDANPVAQRPPRGGRLNEYHASCVLSIVRQVLEALPKRNSTDQDNFRIGVATPYRLQATRIQSQLKREGLDDQVRAGTIHSFQGLQFEVVVFDTVESPPIIPRGDFIVGGWRSSAMRLVNVAVTRPQHKLIIIANLPHLKACFTEEDTLLQAVQEAERSERIMSKTLAGLDVF